MGNSVIHTYLRVENDTDSDIITTSVYEYDDYDWQGSNCVYNNFNYAYISAGSYKEEREDLNSRANGHPFTMTLKFRDGTSDTFRINMGYAIDCPCDSFTRDSMFHHKYKTHNISYRLGSYQTLIITIDNTYAQKENIRAKQMNKEGEALMKKKRYEEAIEKFDEAYRNANESSTINQINYNRSVTSDALAKEKQNNKALELNNEGLVQMKSKNYQLAKKKYEEALKIANESGTVSLIKYNMEAAEKKEKDATGQRLNKEGEEEMKKHNYENALSKFEQAAKLANDEWTIRSVNDNLKKARVAYEPEKLNKEGLKLVMSKKYEEARKKFEEALTKATDSTLIETIKLNMSFMEKKKLNDKAIQLNNQGLVLMRSKDYQGAVKKYDEALTFANVSETVSFIEYNKEAALKKAKNLEAEQLNEEGKEEMKNGDYSSAMEKFEKASKLATDHWTTRDIGNNLNSARKLYTEEMKTQGEDLMKRGNFEEAIKKFDAALEVATEKGTIETISKNKNAAVDKLSKKHKDDKAKQLINEAKKGIKRNNYEAALKKFEEALQLANEESTINSAKISKSEAYNHYGRHLLQEGINLEKNISEDKSKEAQEKFTRAEEVFALAETLHHTTEHETDLKNLKIRKSGNEIINKAVRLESEGYQTFENSDYDSAKKKFEEAVSKYEEAAKKYAEASVLSDNLKLAQEQVTSVKQIITDIEKIELEKKISKLHVKAKTEKKTNINSNEEKQIYINSEAR